MRNMNWLHWRIYARWWCSAVLVSANPTLLEIENKFESPESVLISFKPRRETTKDLVQNLPETVEKSRNFTDEPVFDGQYSNQCYQDRIREAYQHYKEESGKKCLMKLAISDFPPSVCIPRGRIVY